MFENLTVFRMAHAMAMHAGQRQAILAENVANADTPGYRPRDLPSFAEQFRDAQAQMMGAASRHRGPGAWTKDWRTVTQTTADEERNGNAVSIEREILKAVDAKRQHDRAVAIYKSSLGILRATLSR